MDKDGIININVKTTFKSIFNHLEDTIKYRLTIELTGEATPIPELNIEQNPSYLAQFISENHLENEDVILLLLTIVPQLTPSFISNIITEFLPNGGEFAEFGGAKGKNHRGILPTAETALYILYGNDIEERLKGIEYIQSDSFLFKNKIISIGGVPHPFAVMTGQETSVSWQI